MSSQGKDIVIVRVFVTDTRANGWIGYLFTTERDRFGLTNSFQRVSPNLGVSKGLISQVLDEHLQRDWIQGSFPAHDGLTASS